MEYAQSLKLLVERAPVFSGRDLHVTVVANPVAGGFTQKKRIIENRNFIEEAVERVQKRPVTTRSCSLVSHFTNAAGHAEALARAVFFQAEKDSNPSALYLLITAGGDGTSLEVQAAFTHEVLVNGKRTLVDRVCFIRMPFGTGNDATDGRTLDQTLALLTGEAYFARQGAVRLYSTVNEKVNYHAFNIASIGLDAFVTHMTNKLKRIIPGNFYKVWVDAACLFYNKMYTIDRMSVTAMDLNDEVIFSHEDQMLLYAMGVSGFRTYGSNQKILPDTNNVCGVREMPLLRKLKLKKLFRFGAHRAVPETVLYSAKKVIITYNRKILAQVDGESHRISPGDFPLIMECTEPFITILKL